MGEAVLRRHLFGALLVEAAALIALAVVVNALSLSSPGSYALALALLVGAGGGQLFSSRRFKPAAAD